MKLDACRVKHIECSDFSHIVAVWRSAWTATYTPTLGTQAVEAMLRELDENSTASLIPESAQGLCLVHEGEIIGTAVHSKSGPTIYLWGMYVLPEYQRSGAGTLLLQAVRGAAGERPIEIRVLQSSDQANSFYEKHGFQEIGQEETEIMPGIHEICLVMQQTS